MCSLYRVGTLTLARRTLFARWLAICAVAILTITTDPTGAPSTAVAQDLPVVSIVERSVDVDNDAQSVTLNLTTTVPIDAFKSIPLTISTGTGRFLTAADLPKGAPGAPFTVDLSRFEAARNPDGSLTVTVAIGELLEADGSYEPSDDITTINVKPRPAPPPPPPPPPPANITVSIAETRLNVEQGTDVATLNFTTSEAFTTATSIPLSITAGGQADFIVTQVTFEAGKLRAERKFAKADFEPAKNADGSLTLIVKIDDARLASGLVAGNSEATIQFAAPPPAVAPSPPSPPPSPPATPTVSLRDKEVNVDNDTATVTLELTTTQPFSEDKTFALAIAAGGRPNFKTTRVVLPKGAADVEFTLAKADFTSAANPDGSLQLIVKIDDTELDGSFEIGDSETTIRFAAPSAAVAPPAPAAPAAPPTPAAPAPTLTLQTISTGATGTFQFTVDNAGTSRTVSITTTSPDTAATAAAITVTSGPLVITQATATGFTFFDATCGLGPAPHPRTVNVDTRKVTTEMPATGNVACTIINRGAAAHVKTVTARFVKRRAQHLTTHIGQTRRSAGRFSRGRPRGGVGLTGAGTDGHGHVGMRTSLSRLGAALDPDSAAAKAAQLGVNAADYGVADAVRFRSGWDAWAEGSWSYHTTDGGRYGGLASSGQFGVLRAGVDYLVNSTYLFGVVAQYDYLSDSSKSQSRDGYRIRGHGWLAGPYVEFALTDNLFFDAKALWGTSKNEISPDLSFTDQFSTTRWLASARLTGSWTWSHTPRGSLIFSPRAELVWFNENVSAYTDSQGNAIDAQDVHLGRFNIGPEFSYRFTTESGVVIEPSIGAQALLNFSYSRATAGDGLDGASRSSVKDTPLDSFQMRFNGGLKIELPQGTRIELEGSYTGLGKYGYEALSGKIGLTIPLQ